MSRKQCPSCGYLIVDGVGDHNSSVLVLRDYPDFEDQKSGKHLTGPTAMVIRTLFGEAGMSLNACYVTSLYPHVYSEDCEHDYIDNAGKLFAGRKKVLLLGTDAVEPFFKRKAIDLCGVWHKHVAFPKVWFMPCISPATVLSGDLGEFQLALSRFKEK